MASDLAGNSAAQGVDCSVDHVHDYALSMLRAAATEARGLSPGDVLPIGVFLERERENKHVSQQIFNKVRCSAGTCITHILARKFKLTCLQPCQAVFDACAIARAELHEAKVRKSGKVRCRRWGLRLRA